MQAAMTVGIFAIITILVFIFTEPQKRSDLGTIYWNTQKRSPNELAKSFAFAGEADRVGEMLLLDPNLVPNATEFHSAAAKTGVPMLFRRHKVAWRDTEKIILSLLDNIQENPFEVTHAFVVLGVSGFLGSLEDEVISSMVSQINHPEIQAQEEILIRYCVSLGYLGPQEAIDPLVKIMNNDTRLTVQNAARYSLQNMGFYL